MALFALQIPRATDPRFLHGFRVQLIAEGKAVVVANCDNPERLKFPPSLPYAFTEYDAVSPSLRIVAVRDDFLDARGETVAQVSKPAVSPTSKSATLWSSDGLRIWKSTTRQTWKSALLWLRLRRATTYAA
jgi:hypothetical protein